MCSITPTVPPPPLDGWVQRCSILPIQFLRLRFLKTIIFFKTFFPPDALNGFPHSSDRSSDLRPSSFHYVAPNGCANGLRRWFRFSLRPSVLPHSTPRFPHFKLLTVDGAFLVGIWLVSVRARAPPPRRKKNTLHKGRERHCVDVLQGFFWTVTSLYGKISQNECHVFFFHF